MYRDWRLRSSQICRANRDVAAGVRELRSKLTASQYEFVVGEYRSNFTWAALYCLRSLTNNVVVVDDGAAMLRMVRRQSLPRSREQWRARLKVLALRAVGLHSGVPRAPLTFFSSFPIEDRVAANDKVIHNDYRHIRAEIQSLPPDNDCVYVVGGAYLEAGCLASGDIELALALIRFAATYTGKRVVYLAHRREREEKVDALRQEATVVRPNLPFELYLNALGKRPRTMVGYYSSVFTTATELLGASVELIVLEIPREQINDASLDLVDDVYQYYRAKLTDSVVVVDQVNHLISELD